MQEQREFENRRYAHSGRVHKRFSRTLPQEDFKDPFQVVSSFSYGANPPPSRNKSSKMIVKEFEKTQGRPAESGGESVIQEEQREAMSYGVFSGQQDKTAGEVNDKYDLTNWLLLGKSVPESAASHSSTTHSRSRSWHEPCLPSRKSEENKNRLCTGLHTYPPSHEKCFRPEHIYPSTNTADEEKNIFPSFSPRPLGEPWNSYKDWQKTRQKTSSGERNVLDDVIEAGKQSQSSKRQMCNPAGSSLSRPRSLTELRRASSSSSLRNGSKLPRSRSASLPTQTKFDCHVVLDWEEKRNNGVTYVTPFLKKSLSK